MKQLAYLNKYLWKYKSLLGLGVVFIIISNAFGIIPAQLVRHSFDLIKSNFELYSVFKGTAQQEDIFRIFLDAIVVYGVLILLMAVLRGIFLFLVRQTIIVMSRHIEYDLKNEIYNHYQSLPLSFYRRNNTGDLMARISEDVSRVRMYIGPAIMYGLNLVALFVMIIPIMFSVNARLTLYALIPLPLLSVSIYYVHNIINKRSERIQRSLSELSTFVQEAFSGIRVIKSFVREADSERKFVKASEDYKDKSLQLAFVNALFFPIMISLIGLSIILTVYIGGAEVIAGNISIGVIAEFIIYVNMLTWPVASLGWVTSIVQRAAASQERINEFLLTKNEIVSEKKLKHPVKGKISFNNVSFTYPDSGIKALQKVTFSVDPGESIGIIGTTGSGKSTIANLVCRLYDADDGSVHIDDIDIKDYDIQFLRSHFGYVPQDGFLFSDSISRNIAFGAAHVNDDQIKQAAKDADVYRNIMDFPKQFNTMLGERGITLSGGQKQRISIARAIVREPKVIILDDSLSAVDTKTENAILNNLQRIMKGKTTIIISHRVSSAKLANKILVLDDGCIVEQGSHEELMSKSGVYKDLYDKQLQADEVVD